MYFFCKVELPMSSLKEKTIKLARQSKCRCFSAVPWKLKIEYEDARTGLVLVLCLVLGA